MPTVRIVGPGRAGSSLSDALESVGWRVAPAVGRGDDPSGAARDIDLCVVAVRDASIAEVAAAIDPEPSTLVAHLAGAWGPDILVPHQRRAALHPLASLPDRRRGAQTLLDGVWWAVDGDRRAAEVVAALHGRPLAVDPAARATYHAAACIASNHLVALLAQVERVAAGVGLPPEPFYDLAARALANARASGARAAITGPAARGDTVTVAGHVDALDPDEWDLYAAGAAAAAALGGQPDDVIDTLRALAPNRYRIGAKASEVAACR